MQPIEPKDPDATRDIQWDVSDDVLEQETTLVSATVTEVDSADSPLASPTMTLGTPTITSSGFVTVRASGGLVGSDVYLRCAYVLANGETDHATIVLPIRNR